MFLKYSFFLFEIMLLSRAQLCYSLIANGAYWNRMRGKKGTTDFCGACFHFGFVFGFRLFIFCLIIIFVSIQFRWFVFFLCVELLFFINGFPLPTHKRLIHISSTALDGSFPEFREIGPLFLVLVFLLVFLLVFGIVLFCLHNSVDTNCNEKSSFRTL